MYYQPHPLIEHRHSARLQKIDYCRDFNGHRTFRPLHILILSTPAPHPPSNGHPLHPLTDSLCLGSRNKDKKAGIKAAALRPFLSIRQSVSSSPVFPCASADIILFDRIDVVAKKHDGGRGQAFVVFEEQVAATAALRALTGETFYNKELVRAFFRHHLLKTNRKQRISYAQKPSYATTTRQDPSASREAAAIQAAKLTVSRAQDEYEQLEKERHDEEAGLLGEKRGLEDGDEERGAKRVKQEDDEAMEIEMDEGWSITPSCCVQVILLILIT